MSTATHRNPAKRSVGCVGEKLATIQKKSRNSYLIERNGAKLRRLGWEGHVMGKRDIGVHEEALRWEKTSWKAQWEMVICGDLGW